MCGDLINHPIVQQLHEEGHYVHLAIRLKAGRDQPTYGADAHNKLTGERWQEHSKLDLIDAIERLGRRVGIGAPT
jgi:hypothetical protein